MQPNKKLKRQALIIQIKRAFIHGIVVDGVRVFPSLAELCRQVGGDEIKYLSMKVTASNQGWQQKRDEYKQKVDALVEESSMEALKEEAVAFRLQGFRTTQLLQEAIAATLEDFQSDEEGNAVTPPPNILRTLATAHNVTIRTGLEALGISNNFFPDKKDKNEIKQTEELIQNIDKLPPEERKQLIMLIHKLESGVLNLDGRKNKGDIELVAVEEKSTD